MGVPSYFYTWVDSQTDAGKITAARLNGDFAPLYACLDPAVGGLEDTNVKAGAKIVCTDRAHTVTGVWTFTTAPVLPDASIADAKLSSNVMLKTTYDTDVDGQVEDADTVDGSHAAAFAAVAHNHNLNDLTEKSYNSLTDKPAAGAYALPLTALTFDPADNSTYHFGIQAAAPHLLGIGGVRRVYIPKTGSIKTARVYWYGTAAGSAEDISMYIRLNNTTDTLVKTVGESALGRLFDNASLNIAVVAGDYIEIKIVCPTWVTNPTGVLLGGIISIE